VYPVAGLAHAAASTKRSSRQSGHESCWRASASRRSVSFCQAASGHDQHHAIACLPLLGGFAVGQLGWNPQAADLALNLGTRCAAGGAHSAGGTSGGAGGSLGGFGGARGDGGGQTLDGGLTCADLQALYAEALPAARSCDVNASGQCQQLVSSSLSMCPVCTTHVNDSSTLTAIKARWMQAGCDTAVAVIYPEITYVQPGASVCVAVDGGGGTCNKVYLDVGSGIQSRLEIMGFVLAATRPRHSNCFSCTLSSRRT
jgi:hypothetical protein